MCVISVINEIYMGLRECVSNNVDKKMGVYNNIVYVVYMHHCEMMVYVFMSGSTIQPFISDWKPESASYMYMYKYCMYMYIL
jgi:hypothetical protein